MKCMAILALVSTLLVPLAAATAQDHPPDAPRATGPETAPPTQPDKAQAADAPSAPAALSVEELTARVKKSVCVVTSTGRDGRNDGMGTGFVVSSDGLVATNFHVIRQGRGVNVQLSDGRKVDVKAVHASDRALDLAVLRVDAKDLPALELGSSSEVKQGQDVIALGNPHGLQNSVVSGVVSAVREMEGRPMIQVAIPIEPGNSGGPLVDMQGRVQGVMTMKSLQTPNLGFALVVDLLKPLLEKPNPIPMSRWLTIGALDSREWQTVFGARWRQRAGRITVEGSGDGFGGRSLCLSELDVPDRPYEVAVSVLLDDESGAAGLAFGSDGEDRHWGFYPSNGKLRLTRFDGPNVTRWIILHDKPSRHYLAGQWNTLRVRLESGRVFCFVNDEPVAEVADSSLESGRVGLVKFRETAAQFKDFRLGVEVPRDSVPPLVARRIEELVELMPAGGPLDDRLVDVLSVDADSTTAVLRKRALILEKRAGQLRALADAAHQRRVIDDLVKSLSGEEDAIDLFRSSLFVARLDNEEVEVDAYREELERMASELADALPADADDAARLDALRKYLFEENGFHGSRGDYYNEANSYLNEVLDDREGLPITLSIVYMELARRIGLNVVGIGLPGHFVVAHVTAEGPRKLIDVFEGAKPVTHDEAVARVRETTAGALSDEQLEKSFEPVTKKAIVARMLINLLNLADNEADVHRYLNAILAIEPDNGRYHFLRALVRLQLDDRDAARDDVTWLLDHEPADIDLDRVRALRAMLDRE